MTIKVISLNLWWKSDLLPEIVEFLRAEMADVVLLQEVIDAHERPLAAGRPSLEGLRQGLAYPYEAYEEMLVSDEGDGRLSLGNAVLSKFGIQDSAVTFLVESTRETYQNVPEQWPIFPRILQTATLDTPVGTVNIGNVHGVWDLDGDNPSPARRVMVDKILAAFEGKSNVIVAGDTNASQGNPLLKDIEKVLPSVFGDTLTSTFNMRRKSNPGYATAAVDHMYVSSNIKVLARDCPNVDISDHLPLIATLEI